MNMKKTALYSLLTAALGLSVYLAAQAGGGATAGGGAAKSESGSKLSNILLENFEDAGSWQGTMPIDLGIIRVMRREGASKELKAEGSNANRYVLGARINYFKSGPSWFSLTPPREIPIPGVTKSISVWVSGRNYNHQLKAVLKDFHGDIRYANFGKMNFPGWQKMTAQISPHIVQDNFKMNPVWRPRGVKVTAMLVDCAMDETTGEYFMYLDNLSAVTEMFAEENVDPDDMVDDW